MAPDVILATQGHVLVVKSDDGAEMGVADEGGVALIVVHQVDLVAEVETDTSPPGERELIPIPREGPIPDLQVHIQIGRTLIRAPGKSLIPILEVGLIPVLRVLNCPLEESLCQNLPGKARPQQQEQEAGVLPKRGPVPIPGARVL